MTTKEFTLTLRVTGTHSQQQGVIDSIEEVIEAFERVGLVRGYRYQAQILERDADA